MPPGPLAPDMKAWPGSARSNGGHEWLCGKLGRSLNQWTNQREGLVLLTGAGKMKHTRPGITPSKLHILAA